MTIWAVVGLWLLGCALRFFVPYILEGFRLVAQENTWKAWPAWEWKLLTAFLTASMVFGLSLIPEAIRDVWMAMSAEAIILAAYVGEDVTRRAVKVAEKSP